MSRALLAMLLFLAACGRPLSTGEKAFAATLFGPELSTKNVRIAPFPALSSFTQTRPPRPRVACRERIWPKPELTSGKVETYTAGVTTWNRINIANKLYLPDYMAKYPKRMSLAAAMLIGHEMTHVWQWQNRARTHYTPWKAASEHRPGTDPYLLKLDAKTHFLGFPYEQQAAIVEEYICCRALDPGGKRTRRLHAMLADAMPVAPLDTVADRPTVVLPFNGVQTHAICS